MRSRILVAAAMSAALAGCSWIPIIGAGAPHLTNDAVEACKKKARDQDFSGVGERQSAPLGGGRYTVVLDAKKRDGYTTVTCAFDPEKGAELQQSPTSQNPKSESPASTNPPEASSAPPGDAPGPASVPAAEPPQRQETTPAEPTKQ